MRIQPLLMVLDYGDGVVMDTATVERFAGILQQIQYGHADCQLFGLYALDADNKPVPVEYTVEGAPDYDDNQMAYPVVRVTYPDGSTEEVGYSVTIDGELIDGSHRLGAVTEAGRRAIEAFKTGGAA